MEGARRDPPHVLVVVNSLGFGGTERMLERMVVHLSQSGQVRFTVCSLGDEGPIGGRLRAKGIEVVALGARGGTLRVVVRGLLGVHRLLRRKPFDLIHSFLYRSHCAARLARFGRSRRIPLVSSERCLGDNRSASLLLVNRLMSRLSDRIVVVSEAVRDRAIFRDRIPRSKVLVVRNGIEGARSDPSSGARLRRTLGIAPSEVVFLALGRLHREKGPDLFLKSLALLRGSGTSDWRAILVGDGPAREELEELAKSLGVRPRVFFAGARARIDPWIDACDVLVLPSREEGLPVSALEAMGRGKPVVATRVGGTPEVVIAGETGLLVPPEDAQALSAALGRLAGDPEARGRMGQHGMQKVRSEFSIDRMAGEILHLYQDLLGRAHVTPSPDREGALVLTPGE